MILIRYLWGLRPWSRHSAVLMVAGVMYSATGVVYIVTQPPEIRRNALFIAYYWLPSPFWGCLFVVVGLLAMLSSRWPRVSESWGYITLTGVSTGWGGVYLAGTPFSHTPSANITGALIWGMFAFLWWAISGLLNPSKVAIVDERC